ncbi:MULTISPECIES: VanZ family protein [Flavobacterium]|uniref:VanZ family protein n=1 Tax=Flavobacterium cupriresistens TaxID=2893885 RepID=A0ABU4R8Y9_9FLAO|nr:MULTISPECIES: VanZ family protein [unclassified Flavobacterium]KLT71801.1 membrane protein [Flavobacterium sp. ABG]MDX6189037.1 VanZ family protein [Flavobacterium sp. Fl-318]UFH44183.1 VanZ family protein [Flavobacterium sp. F-323]
MPKQILLCWAIICSGIISYFCLTDSSNIPAVSFPSIDKVVHFCFHFGFTISWILFFKKELKGKSTDDFKAYLISFIFSVFFGITIEILQGVLTTTRAADVADVLANTIGSTTAIFTAIALKKQIDKI